MNIPTSYAVKDEVYNILQTFHIPYAKMYASSYDAAFLSAVANELKDKLPTYHVILTTGDDYVLEIKRYEV